MLFAEIRAAARWVAGRARHVRVSEDRLREYAAEIPEDGIRAIGHDPAAHVLGQGAATLAFFVVLDAINFGSGWFPVLRKRPGCSGYFTVAHALKDHFAEHGAPSAGDLRRLTPDACAAIFGQDLKSEAGELMAHFARALNDLGALLDRSYGGSFEALVTAAGRRAERLVLALSEMPLYQDASAYHGRMVPFFKRAQLTCADLWLALDGTGLGAFDDIDALTIFADNLVPHVLRVEGVLVYDDDLARRIDDGVLIAAGSDEEVEIRACALDAVERMVAECARRGRSATARALDVWLWTRGGRPDMKARPRHRCRSTFY